MFPKTVFSMATPEVLQHVGENLPNLKTVILFGIEVSSLPGNYFLILSDVCKLNNSLQFLINCI